VGIESQFNVRRYGVSIEAIETLAVPSIVPEPGSIICLDEIGKMECFSELFRNAAIRALDSENVLIGTIAIRGDDFIEGIKNRSDIELIEATLENRDMLEKRVTERLEDFLKD